MCANCDIVVYEFKLLPFRVRLELMSSQLDVLRSSSKPVSRNKIRTTNKNYPLKT